MKRVCVCVRARACACVLQFSSEGTSFKAAADMGSLKSRLPFTLLFKS